MVEYGPTEDGYIRKDFNQIIEDMKAVLTAEYNNEIDLSETSILYIILKIVALELANTWTFAEAQFYAAFVDTAEGLDLDRVAALVGITRNPPSRATVTVTFTGTPATAIPADTRLLTSEGTVFYTLVADVVGGGGTVDIECAAFEPGNDGNVASAAINALETPIAGITGVTNTLAASGGEDEETDLLLRDRTKKAVLKEAKGTLTAIEQALLAYSGVESVLVTEDLTDHSIDIVLYGVTSPSSAIDDIIDATRPAGIGATWINPSQIDIYIDATVSTTNPPGDAQTQIENAIIAHINGLDIGEDVIYTKLYDVIFNVGDWIDDVTSLTTGTAPAPVGTSNIVITNTQIAKTDVAKLGITVV